MIKFLYLEVLHPNKIQNVKNMNIHKKDKNSEFFNGRLGNLYSFYMKYVENLFWKFEISPIVPTKTLMIKKLSTFLLSECFLKLVRFLAF